MAAQFATDSMDNPLWDFCLALYAKPGMQEMCLRLQNEAGMDVLMLLADRWLVASHQDWIQEELLADYIEWRVSTIEPLRAIRMGIERGVEPLRSQLLQAELSAERLGINKLYRALEQDPKRAKTDNDSLALLDLSCVFLSAVDAQKKEAIKPLFLAFIEHSQT